MTKDQILTSVIELSGRPDLSENMITGQTKGEFFLQAGLKLLDTAQQTPESQRWYMADLTVGQYKVNFQNARAVKEVWMANSDGRFRLIETDLNKLKENYADLYQNADTGEPKYYAVNSIHLSPQERSLLSGEGFTYDYQGLMFGDSYGYNGILWMPPTDTVYTVEILADFFSVMSESDDRCYWSIVYPNVLIQATLFAIEVFYRNSQGMQDYLTSLKPFIQGIDFDLAVQESNDFNQMEG